MADHSKPTVTSTYTNFVTEIDQRLDDISKWYKSSSITPTYIPQNTVRWNDTTYRWEINQATDATQTPSWAEFSNRYDININGTVGATTPTTGSFTTITTSGIATLGASSTVGGVAIVTTTGTQTLTNKTLTSPTISTISNTGTITLPTATTTLVGTNTTDTLTNKTLTAPRFVNTGFIADSNGNELVEFGVTASAVNNIRVTNSITGTAPIVEAMGTDTNINLNIRGKGTGTIQLNGIQAVDLSTAQTLTNKTIGSGGVWNGGTIGNTYGGTGNTSAFTQGGVTYASSSTVLATSAQGTSGQLLQSGGTSAPSWVSASSLSVNFATTAGRARPRRSDDTAIDIYWSGQSGQPSWLVGSNNGTDFYVWNPSNFNVNYATTAGSASSITNTVTGTGSAEIVRGNMADNDQFRILIGGTGSNQGFVEIATADDGNEPIYVRQYTGVFSSLVRTATLLDASGNSIFPGNVTAYSDQRLKTSIKTIESALNKVLELRGVTFIKDGKKGIGLIAQEVQKILPEVVVVEQDTINTLSVAYGNIVGVLIEAIKELNTKVDNIKTDLGI